MSINDNTMITVYNRNPFNVSISTDTRTYRLSPCYDMDIPTFCKISFAELEYVNSISKSIRNGMIEFDEDVAKDVYKKLRIEDEDILTNADIVDIILNPNKEKIKTLIEISDTSVFDRVNALYVGLINDKIHDISTRVADVIRERQKEISHGILVSKIKVVDNDDAIPSGDEQLEDIKLQNLKLQEQMLAMQETMAKLLASQSGNVEEKPTTAKKTTTTSTTKKVGRPRKTTK